MTAESCVTATVICSLNLVAQSERIILALFAKTHDAAAPPTTQVMGRVGLPGFGIRISSTASHMGSGWWCTMGVWTLKYKAHIKANISYKLHTNPI